MTDITEVSPAELSTISSTITWTGLAPGYKLTNDNAATLLSYCSGLASAAIWVCVDVGVWKRNQLRRLYTVGSGKYNEAVNGLYAELSEYMPSVQSGVSWRSYLNVGSAVPYESRVESFGPAVYLPALTLEPDAFASFVLAVQEGTHRDFLLQLYGQRVDARKIAPTASGNGYGPPAAPDDDVPFSASGPGVWADADEAVMEYEGQSPNDDLPTMSWETMAEVRALVTAVLLERWTEAVEIAEKLETVIGES